MSDGFRRIAVCGAGAMGSGIAQVAAQAGAQVVVFDVDPASLSAGQARIADGLSALVRRGRLAEAEAGALSAAITWTDDLAALAGSDLVIEAIVEDLAVKQSLFARIEGVVGDHAILASNTSSLPIARLARGLARPDRFLGMHFFNPATAMKLVEVIAGPATAPEIGPRIEALAARWGKVPVRVADVPGFIVNRVARPFYAEAFRAMQEGADPALIDHLFRAAGFRMGPLELTDLIGQDVNFAVARSVYDSYFGVTRFVPQLAQAALVDAGWLGRKTMRGVYDYREGAARPSPPRASTADPLNAVPAIPQMPSPNLAPFEVRGALVRFTRGFTARREAVRERRPVAVLDWCAAQDGNCVGFAASDDSAAGAAAGLLASWGKPAYRLSDRPGLLLTRTLAQIANAAGDAVSEQVSDEAGIDAALRYGANYPFGPFAWADGIGKAALAATLANIAQETGAGLYEPSEYWRRYVP